MSDTDFDDADNAERELVSTADLGEQDPAIAEALAEEDADVVADEDEDDRYETGS